MKTTFLFVLFVLYSFIAPAQKKDEFETLDHFFAGIPLKDEFANWIRYVEDHPFLGFDSSGKRGHYSSFKPGMKSNFPFPNSLQVKLLLKKVIYRDSLTNKPFDSSATVMIEGVFADNKEGRKKSLETFREIRKSFRKHYNDVRLSHDGSGYWFRKAKKSDFPECSLWHGYETNKGFYYVLISYDFPIRTDWPWYLELAS